MIVLPLRALPFANGQTPQNLVGVGYLRAVEELGTPALPFVITFLPPVPFLSNEIMAAGFDNWMLAVDVAAVGGSMTYEYEILDPQSLATLVTRTISAAVAPGVTLLTFGASSASAPAATRGDVWFVFRLKLTANASPQTVNNLRLWGGVR